MGLDHPMYTSISSQNLKPLESHYVFPPSVAGFKLNFFSFPIKKGVGAFPQIHRAPSFRPKGANYTSILAFIFPTELTDISAIKFVSMGLVHRDFSHSPAVNRRGY